MNMLANCSIGSKFSSINSLEEFLLHIAAKIKTIPLNRYAEMMSKGVKIGLGDKFTGRNL